MNQIYKILLLIALLPGCGAIHVRVKGYWDDPYMGCVADIELIKYFPHPLALISCIDLPLSFGLETGLLPITLFIKSVNDSEAERGR